jgi:hypothetical protein
MLRVLAGRPGRLGGNDVCQCPRSHRCRTGAAFVALILIGNPTTNAGPAQNTGPAGEQLLRDAAYQASSVGGAAGVAFELLAFAAFICFPGYLADVLRRAARGRPGSLAAGAAVVSGAVTLAVKLGSGAPVLESWADHGHIGPQLALVLNDLASVTFVIGWLPFAVFVAAAAAALHRVDLDGRPTAYAGLLLGIAGVALSVIGAHDLRRGRGLAIQQGHRASPSQVSESRGASSGDAVAKRRASADQMPHHTT